MLLKVIMTFFPCDSLSSSVGMLPYPAFEAAEESKQLQSFIFLFFLTSKHEMGEYRSTGA